MPATYLALLRGVNVGGKNKLPMKELAGIFVAAGCDNVRTYIQSGNVLFQAAPKLLTKIPDLVGAQITGRYGYRTPVIVRTQEELGQVMANNPFLAKGETEEWLHVMFLAAVPKPAAVTGLDANRSPGDSFIVQGKEIYLHLPNGAGKSKLTNNYFDSKLATISTGRNWRTVATLLELMKGDS